MKKLKNNKNKQTKGLIHRVCFLICAQNKHSNKSQVCGSCKSSQFYSYVSVHVRESL